MKITEDFKELAPDARIVESEEERQMYSHDIGDIPALMEKALFSTMPYFTLQPESEDDIIKVFRFANKKNIPVIPRGAASWGFGGVIPINSGIVVDMSPSRKIIEFNRENKTVTVQAGARWSDIDIFAKKEGLSLMTYPSSKFSTVGGWLATGGLGINNFRFGHVSKQVEKIRVVVPSGETKTLSPDDREFRYFIGTEGVFGIITEITLKLRIASKGTHPVLFYFETDWKAFEFIGKLIKKFGNKIDNEISNKIENEININVIRFLDENHLHDTNQVIKAGVFKEKPAVLVEVESENDEEKLLKFTGNLNFNDINNIEKAPRHASSYLWNERLFGMKTKRLGPTILASEIIIPIKEVPGFIKKAKKLGENFGVEIGIDSYIVDEKNALLMITFLCDSRKLKYYVNLPLTMMLTKIGTSRGAKPYGLGIWNSPFINQLFNSKMISEFKDYKKKIDPDNILNPGKFFGVRSKWLNIPSLVFNPLVFNPLMNLMIIISPITGRIATLLFGRDEKIEKLDLELSTHACAKCGNCISVCPAYLITKNEAVTAKGKVALAKKIAAGKKITKEEAQSAFLCMHCKACEDICQTNLELMPLWDAMEEKLEKEFGRPEEKIKDFLKKIDESPEYWEMVERNS